MRTISPDLDRRWCICVGRLCRCRQAKTLAIADFEFRDTSGEVRDQTAEHEARLKAFDVALQGGLSGNQKIDLVALPCQAERCTIKDPGFVDLTKRARTASAKYLLIGQVHKMSTLVGRP
ncbi:DUF2380 domain-containing protein [Mesorhizobium sp.]|uniref:DUF2380 domain-containing protein n=1 Tax=Mesorhizobium sp. TaxID=1871066 RepID=UPI00121866AF|nr:MAG: DUF2380 domain-containing protein [Mesorhizobium sp.]